MKNNLFDIVYRQIIYQMNSQMVLPAVQDGQQHDIDSNNTIVSDYSTFQNLNGQVIDWAANVFDYPFYFKAETVSNITLTRILRSILLETAGFWSLLNDLEKLQSGLTSLLTNKHRQYSSIKLQLDLILNGRCLEKYKNTEYNWVRYDFRSATGLINKIYEAKNAKDERLIEDLLDDLISVAEHETVIIPKENQISPEEATAIGQSSTSNILTLEQFETIKAYNRTVATKAFDQGQLAEQVINILRSKERIQLAVKSDDPTIDTTVPSDGLMLAYNENKHTRYDTIRKKDGTEVYYKLVFPFMLYNQNLHNKLPAHKNTAKEFFNAYQKFGAINILVKEGNSFTSHSLKELWNFNGIYQRNFYPAIFNMPILDAYKIASKIVNEDTNNPENEENSEQ